MAMLSGRNMISSGDLEPQAELSLSGLVGADERVICMALRGEFEVHPYRLCFVQAMIHIIGVLKSLLGSLRRVSVTYSCSVSEIDFTFNSIDLSVAKYRTHSSGKQTTAGQVGSCYSATVEAVSKIAYLRHSNTPSRGRRRSIRSTIAWFSSFGSELKESVCCQ